VKPRVSPSIHPDALAYERSRPGYPAEAVDALVAALPGRDVIDLAAGTGKLTRDLLARGLDVVAVEPRAEMRAAIEPPARVIEGSAEAIPLPAGSADAVAIAQAFHWFAVPAALAEIHRVLRSGGVLALLWNRRLSEGAHAALEQLLAPIGDPAHAYRNHDWRSAFDVDRLFGALHTQVFDNERVLDADELAEHVGARPFVAVLEDAQRVPLLDSVRALAGDGPVTLRFRAELHIARSR
jgi:SAM-dependent methyltransferase